MPSPLPDPLPVRSLTTADAAAYRALSAGAFGGRFDLTPEEAAAPLSPGQSVLGIDSSAMLAATGAADGGGADGGGADGVLAAGARILHHEIALGGGRARSGGVAGLAVHPAHRGDGLFGAMVDAVIARCDAEGIPFSMLFASNPEIYRRHGYQVVARPESLVVPLVDLQRIRPVPGRRTLPVTAATMPRLRALYTELTAGDNGMLRREGPHFPEGLPGGGWEAVLLVGEDGTDRGYASWTRRRPGPGTAEGRELEVHEVLGRDRDDLRALLRVLGTWSTLVEELRLRVRTEDPVLDVLPGGRARRASDAVPLVLMRVIDTAAALAARPAPAGVHGALRLIVEDATVPPGTCRAAGAFDVVAVGGQIRVLAQEPTEAAASADLDSLGTVHLDVHAASLLLTGGRSLADARRLGLRAEADDPRAAALLDALLAGPRPSVLDAF